MQNSIKRSALNSLAGNKGTTDYKNSQNENILSDIRNQGKDGFEDLSEILSRILERNIENQMGGKSCIN